MDLSVTGLFKKENGIAFILFFLLSLITVMPILINPGWPMNHEGNSFFIRTAIYSSHILSGDIFPIWSSLDNFGFGSPQPALYHKLFYFISGELYALLGYGYIKESIVLAIWFWLFIGAYGTFTLCRETGCCYWLAIGGGIMLLSSNYTTTNWLIRGAMAEFSGAMLVPWVLASFIKSIKSNRIQLWLPISFALIFLSHSVMAYFLAIIFSLALLFLILQQRLSLKNFRTISLIQAIICFFLLVGIFLIVLFLIGQDYNMSRIIPDHYLPENQIKPLGKYIYDAKWKWGVKWTGYTVALDPIVLMLLLGGSAFFYFYNSQQHQFLQGLFNNISILVLVIISGLGLFLQTELAIPFYRYFPGANFIQFPWRLLALLTPIFITLSLSIINMISSKVGVIFVTCCAIVMFLFNGAFAPMKYKWFSVDHFSLEAMQLSAFDEYVPVKYRDFSKNSYNNVIKKMAAEGSTIYTPQPLKETTVRQYLVYCIKPNTVVLPEFSSMGHTIKIGNAPFQRCNERTDFSSLCAVSLPAGESRVEIHYPTIFSTIKSIAK